jgi:SAM-dependent methyltransferase
MSVLPSGPVGSERCVYCAGPVVHALSARAPDRPAGPVYDYVECTVCGGLALSPSEAAAEVDYAGDYYTARQRIAGRVPPLVRVLRRRLTRFRLGLRAGRFARAVSGRRYGRFDWFRRTGIGPDDAILDVGCGSGRLLFRLHADGFRDLVGLDPNLPPATAARAADHPGLRFERGTPQSHRGRYRLVMAHHSFEHMPDPRASFAALAALVAPGGCLLLRVPLADSFARRHYGAAWAQLDPPRHLHIPTRASLEHLAAAEGLAIFHVEDDSGVFQIQGSERDRPRGGPARLVHWLAARRAAGRLRRAGRGDQAAFYLRRLT